MRNLVISLLFVLTLIHSTLADDGERVLAGFDPHTDLIAENYEAGAFLIYDCVEGHWTCVRDVFYKECEAKREEDRLMRSRFARCAPLGQLPTKKSCFQRQLFMTGHHHGTRFCILSPWKEKEI